MDDISSSYLWTNGRNTFPANWWLEILCDYLKDGLKTSEIEKNYRKTLPHASKTSNKSNNMYISVLLNRFLLNKNSRGVLKDLSYKDAEKVIKKYVNNIIAEALPKYKLPKKWLEEINRWEQYIESKDNEFSKEQLKNVGTFIKNTVNKIKEAKYKFSEIKSNDFGYSYNQNNLEQIGRIGEQIIYNMMVNEYGIENVEWVANYNKYAEYDIKVNADGVEKYIEVKSSISAKMSNWFISRKELEFYKKNKKNYELFFVKNVFLTDKISSKDTAIVTKIINPNIETSNQFFGILENKLIVTPIKYKGFA